MKRCALYIFLSAVLLTAAPAWAADAAPGGAAPNLWSAALKMVGVLAVLLGATFLAVRVMKRLGLSGGRAYGGPELIRILGARALAPKKYIALVEVGDSVLTLGVTGENISFLDKTPAEQFRTATDKPEAENTEPGFARRLKAMAAGLPVQGLKQ